MKHLHRYLLIATAVLLSFVLAVMISRSEAQAHPASEAMTSTYIGLVNGWYVYRVETDDATCYTYAHGIACQWTSHR